MGIIRDRWRTWERQQLLLELALTPTDLPSSLATDAEVAALASTNLTDSNLIARHKGVWTTNTSWLTGDIVQITSAVANGYPLGLWRCTTTHLGGMTFSGTSSGYWVKLAGDLDSVTASGAFLSLGQHFHDAAVHGVKADGVTDNATAIAATIAAAEAGGNTIPILWPAGDIRHTTTIQINNRGHRWFSAGMTGRVGTGRAGTSFTFDAASGAAIQLGTDNGHAWDANDYDGPRDFEMHGCYLNPASSRRTTLLDNGLASYAPNTYGIRSWRAGNIILDKVWMQGFDYSFWGIQSDLNDWEHVYIEESHSGVYLGPRSDQFTARGFYFTSNDRDIIFDGAQGARIHDSQHVGTGCATKCPIVIGSTYARGTYKIVFSNTWLEKFGNLTPAMFDVNPHEQLGGAAGYADANPTHGVVIEDPLVLLGAASANYLVRYGTNAGRMTLKRPEGPNIVTNFTKMVLFNAATAVQLRYESHTDLKCTYNSTGGTAPNVQQLLHGYGSNELTGSASGRLYLRSEPPAPTKDLSIYAPAAGTIAMAMDGDGSGNTSRFFLSARYVEAASAPTTNTWQQGDYVRNWSPVEAGTAAAKYVVLGWVCVAGGTPGTWLPCRVLTGN